VLPSPIARESFKAVSGRNSQFVNANHTIEHQQLSVSKPLKFW
jgi:hypothetical protein